MVDHPTIALRRPSTGTNESAPPPASAGFVEADSLTLATRFSLAVTKHILDRAIAGLPVDASQSRFRRSGLFLEVLDDQRSHLVLGQ